MNILKNMEAVFLVSLAIAGPASVVIDALPEANATRTPAAVATQQAIPVVVVSARRMTDEEKRQSLEEEARAASVELAARSSF